MRIWLAALGFIAIAVIRSAHADDCGEAPDQTSMNECAAKEFVRADAELNVLYQRIIGRLSGDADRAEIRKALVAAQRAWVAFRDAECAFVGSSTIGGTINPTIVASCRAAVTNKRIDDFKAYLKCEEGNLSCPVPAN